MSVILKTLTDRGILIKFYTLWGPNIQDVLFSGQHLELWKK